MPSCSIKRCSKSSRTSNRQKDGITFHRFPKCPIRRRLWAEATGRDAWSPSKYNYVCSRHFHPECFTVTRTLRRRLFEEAVPTLLLPSLDELDLELRNNPTSAPLKPNTSVGSTLEAITQQVRSTILANPMNTVVENQEMVRDLHNASPNTQLQITITDLTLKVNHQSNRIKCLQEQNRRLRRTMTQMLVDKENANKCVKGNSLNEMVIDREENTRKETEIEREEKEEFVVIDESGDDDDDPLKILC